MLPKSTPPPCFDFPKKVAALLPPTKLVPTFEALVFVKLPSNWFLPLTFANTSTSSFFFLLPLLLVGFGLFGGGGVKLLPPNMLGLGLGEGEGDPLGLGLGEGLGLPNTLMLGLGEGLGDGEGEIVGLGLIGLGEGEPKLLKPLGFGLGLGEGLIFIALKLLVFGLGLLGLGLPLKAVIVVVLGEGLVTGDSLKLIASERTETGLFSTILPEGELLAGEPLKLKYGLLNCAEVDILGLAASENASSTF